MSQEGVSESAFICDSESSTCTLPPIEVCNIGTPCINVVEFVANGENNFFGLNTHLLVKKYADVNM